LNIALMGLVLVLGIGQHLAEALPPNTAALWSGFSQDIAAGKLDTLSWPGQVVEQGAAIAQAALRHGTGWAMFYAGLGSCAFSLLSRFFFSRGR
jgi:hypothetical protein